MKKDASGRIRSAISCLATGKRYPHPSSRRDYPFLDQKISGHLHSACVRDTWQKYARDDFVGIYALDRWTI
jgi:hypothetical protein